MSAIAFDIVGSIHLFALKLAFIVESVATVAASDRSCVQRSLGAFVEPFLLGSRPCVVNATVFALEVDIDVELLRGTVGADVNLLRRVRSNSAGWQATLCDTAFFTAAIHDELGRTTEGFYDTALNEVSDI